MHSAVSTDSLNHLRYRDFAVFLKGVHHQAIAADVVDTLRKEVQAKKRRKSSCKSESKQASTRLNQVCCGKRFHFYNCHRMLFIGPHVTPAAASTNAGNNLKSNCISRYFLSVKPVTVEKTHTWLMSLVHADFSCREDATRMTV